MSTRYLVITGLGAKEGTMVTPQYQGYKENHDKGSMSLKTLNVSQKYLLNG